MKKKIEEKIVTTRSCFAGDCHIHTHVHENTLLLGIALPRGASYLCLFVYLGVCGLTAVISCPDQRPS